MRVLVLLWVCFFSLSCFKPYSQQLDLDSSNYKQSTYVRVSYENDELIKLTPLLKFYDYSDALSDDLYTHGSVIDVMHRVFKFSRYFLISSKKPGFTKDYGIQIAQKIYTPTNIRASVIDYSSRPYAGLGYIAFKSISNNFYRGLKIKSILRTGVTGNISGAGTLQIWAHNLMNQPRPNGWDYQIAKGVSIDFQNFIDKRVFNMNNFLDIIAQGGISIGSIDNYAKIGGLVRVGIFNDYFSNAYGTYDPVNQKKMLRSISKIDKGHKMFLLNKNRKLKNAKDTFRMINKYIKRINKKFTIYFTISPYMNYTFYDGIVSGNLLAFEDNIHTVESNKIINLRYGFKYSIVIGYGRLQIILSEITNSSEIKGEAENNWMSHKVLFRF